MSGKESFKVEEGNQTAVPSPPLSLPPPRALVQRLRGVLHAGHRFQTALVFDFFVFFSAEQRTFRYCSDGCDSGQRPLPLTASPPAPVPPHPPLLSHLRDGAGGVARGPV